MDLSEHPQGRRQRTEPYRAAKKSCARPSTLLDGMGRPEGGGEFSQGHLQERPSVGHGAKGKAAAHQNGGVGPAGQSRGGSDFELVRYWAVMNKKPVCARKREE